MKQPQLMPLFLLPLMTALSCQGISRAPAGTPRVELELSVALDGSYTSKLQGLGAGFTDAVAELVAEHADIGLRFYPIPSSSYSGDDVRPDYVLRVELRDFTVDVDHHTVTHDDKDPTVEVFAKRVGCSVSSTLVRRRDNGPELTVGSTSRTGSAATAKSEEVTEGTTYNVVREGEPISVREADLFKSIEQAVQRSFAELIVPISREKAFGAEK